MLPKAADVLFDVLSKEEIDFELIFVDDGSEDDTWKRISELYEESARIKGIHFSRNFGKEDSVKETHQGCLSRSINHFFKLLKFEKVLSVSKAFLTRPLNIRT